MSRVKTVFGSHAQLAHVWAQREYERGRASDSRMFFEGSTIYSYGYHFPAAKFITDDIVLINEDGYSSSTSKHMGYVRNAVTHKTRLAVSTRVLKAFSDYNDNNPVLFPPMVQDIVLDDAFKAFERGMDKASKRRVKRCKVEDTISAIAKLEHAANIFTTLQTAIPEKLSKAIADYTDANSGAVDAYLKDKQAKVAALQAQRDSEYATVKALWLNHEPILGIHGISGNAIAYGPTLLRVSSDGKEIETSRGARFPVNHGKLAFNYIREVKEGRLEFSNAGRVIHLGHFKIDDISKRGDVLAGCHNVPWESIEHAARVLKIFP